MKKRLYTKSAPCLTDDAGWTFLETIVVIAIILILTAGVGASAGKYVDRARVATARAQIAAFALALELYRLDVGRYPTESQGLDALWSAPYLEPLAPSWNGPYLARPIPRDPWGGLYRYAQPAPNGAPVGISAVAIQRDGSSLRLSSWEN